MRPKDWGAMNKHRLMNTNGSKQLQNVAPR